MEIYTIGFTKKNAERFFGLLRSNGIKRLVDVRLNNSSQLAAFAKKDDLAFFLREICGAEYLHLPLFAPSEELLSAWKGKRLDWSGYERKYMRLITDRDPACKLTDTFFKTPTILLCSEATPEHCHRRLAAEYLAERFILSVAHL
jgi:uncharacterized protein (DUF488 family)